MSSSTEHQVVPLAGCYAEQCCAETAKSVLSRITDRGRRSNDQKVGAHRPLVVNAVSLVHWQSLSACLWCTVTVRWVLPLDTGGQYRVLESIHCIRQITPLYKRGDSTQIPSFGLLSVTSHGSAKPNICCTTRNSGSARSKRRNVKQRYSGEGTNCLGLTDLFNAARDTMQHALRAHTLAFIESSTT